MCKKLLGIRHFITFEEVLNIIYNAAGKKFALCYYCYAFSLLFNEVIKVS